MKTAPDTFDDDTLDALLAQAPRYAPPAGFADRVLAALHEEEGAAAEEPVFATPMRRPWYTRPYGWASAASAAAACLVCAFIILPGTAPQDISTADALALDDEVLVEEVLDAIEDDDLITAICSVSSGSYSIATGAGY